MELARYFGVPIVVGLSEIKLGLYMIYQRILSLVREARCMDWAQVACAWLSFVNSRSVKGPRAKSASE